MTFTKAMNNISLAKIMAQYYLIQNGGEDAFSDVNCKICFSVGDNLKHACTYEKKVTNIH